MSKFVKISLGDELRRVPIGVKGKSENYDDLLSAIKVAFPTTDGATLGLKWKDEDGDMITMSSDAEFFEAMKCMAKGIPKFSLTVMKSAPGDTKASTPINPAPESKLPSNNTTVHDNVECDGCGILPIVGVRYKSTFRANYDLCEKCEAILRPTEPMVKLTTKDPSPILGPAAMLSDTLGQVADTLDGLLGRDDSRRVWKKCNDTAAPLVSAVDQLCSRWTGARTSQPPSTPVPKPALKFLRDASLSDGTQVLPGAALTKQWLVCNDGKTAWPEGATLHTAGGDQLLAIDAIESANVPAPSPTPTTTSAAANTPVESNEVPAGSPVTPPLTINEERVLSVRLTAPQQPGRYVAYFRMKTAEGRRFGHRLWADIVVVAPEIVVQEAPVSPTRSQHSTSSTTSLSSVSNSPSSIPLTTTNATSTPTTPTSPKDAFACTTKSADTLLSTTSYTTAVEHTADHAADIADAYAMPVPLYWHQELALLGEMGFEDIDSLVPLLEKFVKHPAGVYSDGTVGSDTSASTSTANGSVSSEEKHRVAQGLQQVLACLLGTRVTEVYA